MTDSDLVAREYRRIDRLDAEIGAHVCRECVGVARREHLDRLARFVSEPYHSVAESHMSRWLDALVQRRRNLEGYARRMGLTERVIEACKHHDYTPLTQAQKERLAASLASMVDEAGRP